MSQQQPRRPQANRSSHQDPITYGDVFDVSGSLASKPVAPRDAATMESAEEQVLGKIQKGGPAAVMQSAADVNERAGVVGHDQGTGTVRSEGVGVYKSIDPYGNVIVTEAVGMQIVGQYIQPNPVPVSTPTAVPQVDEDANITIGEALEATAMSIGNKPVDQADAAAIQAAEKRAVGSEERQKDGLGASAQSAADFNARAAQDEDKITVSAVVHDATTRLPKDKPVTREDAEGVLAAELRNKSDTRTTAGGVAESMVTAARVNRNEMP